MNDELIFFPQKSVHNRRDSRTDHIFVGMHELIVLDGDVSERGFVKGLRDQGNEFISPSCGLSVESTI